MPHSYSKRQSSQETALYNLAKRQLNYNQFQLSEDGRSFLDKVIAEAIDNSLKGYPSEQFAVGRPQTNVKSVGQHATSLRAVTHRSPSFNQRGKKASTRVRYIRMTPLHHSILILTHEIMKSQYTFTITENDIRRTLQRLCPIWPFC